MANRKKTLSLDDIYRQPVGRQHDNKSLYGRLISFIQWRKVRQYSDRTLRTQSHHLYHFITWCDERSLHYPQEITRPILERYQRHLYTYRKSNGEPLSSRTQRSILSPIQVWFKWMSKQNLILSNPASDLELPKLEKRLPRHILSINEIEHILAQPKLQTLQGLRDRALLEVLWSTGIRRLEAASLALYDIDRERKTLTIRLGKGKKDRVVPIGQRALDWLSVYLVNVRPQLVVNQNEKALFMAMDGLAGLTPNGITNLTSKYIKQSGIAKRGSCHLFRHAMATQMLENGADLRWIQAMLGHASVESTQIYTQVSIRTLQAVHEATHPAQSGALKYPTSELDEESKPSDG